MRFLRPDTESYDPGDPAWRDAFNRAVKEALLETEGFAPKGPVLMKVHIGEPKCDTAIKPEGTTGVLDALSARGVEDVFFGDTTVLYSGPRGGRNNGPGAERYLALAAERGWTERAPFVVLDRPATSVKGLVVFWDEEKVVEREVGSRYKQFSRSGGFDAAGTVVNNVHLTLHTLAHFALCIKGLTMGLAGRTGKLAMHQCLHPSIDLDLCEACGACVACCPEGALSEGPSGGPDLDKSLCVGCGECMAACPEEAIRMAGDEVADWEKGMDSLPRRMADYLMGLMDGRWEEVINVAHLYDVTPLCDCVNVRMKPICRPLGMLVGRNPFAVDLAARRLLDAQLIEEGCKDGLRGLCPLDNGDTMYPYASETFGVVVEPDLITTDVSIV